MTAHRRNETPFSEETIRGAGSVSPHYRITVYPELASTNTTVRALAAEGAPNGTVVLADRQTAGRGRLGRSFFSPGGSSIYMTLLLRPRLPHVDAGAVTTFAAVAVARAIERVSALSAHIKWVNDVWIGERKVCGILAEAALLPSGEGIDYIALGIGINVNQTEFPKELHGIATSLALEAGGEIDRSRLAAALLSELEPLLSCEVPGEHLDEYRARNLVLGRRLTVIVGDESYAAVGKRIEDNGNLTVLMDDGTERCVCAGEVSLRI